MKKNAIIMVWISFLLSVITIKVSAQEGIIGEIRLIAENFAPRNWAFCKGQLLNISQHTALFSILGTTYGGDGKQNFSLPDFQGKVAMGMGQGRDLADIKLGEVTGKEYLTIEEKNMPRHSHGLLGTTSSLDITANGKSVPFILSVSEQTVKDSITTLMQGSAYPFDNRQPSIGLNYIICISGSFPVRSAGLNDILQDPDPFGYTGEIKPFAGNFAPVNWALCTGEKIEKAGHELLFNMIGTSFYSTSTMFFLPDLRGRIVIGAGQGTGLTNRKIAERPGLKQIQLQENRQETNIPHSHQIFNKSTDETKLNDKNYFIPLAVPANVSSIIGSGLTGGNSTPLTNIQPSLAINYLICLKGKTKIYNYLGEIKSIAGTDIPEGWALCDGRSMKPDENMALFSLIYNTYGGDGETTFHLPDLRGRAVIGVGSGINLGDKIGAETTQLEDKNLPPHVHKFAVMEEKNATQSPYTNTKVLAVKRSNEEISSTAFFTDKATRVMPVDNVQPSLVLNYIICVNGIFPVRD